MIIYKTNEELKAFSEQRKERASELLNNVVPERVDETTYIVPSSDGSKKYRVSHIDTYSCECPDYLQRCKGQGLYCKHIQAIVLFNRLKNKVDMDDFDVDSITDEKVCPKCKSENITKFGVRKNKSGTKQRYKCHNCFAVVVLDPLKGNRGNTMITLYESERLFKLLRDKNQHKILKANNLTFDKTKQQIKENNRTNKYSGRKEAIDVLPRLVAKYNRRTAFETHLQAYIIQKIGRNINKSLDKVVLNGESSEWLGNEVSCGVGMQRIDVLLSIKRESSKLVIPIELKAVEASVVNVIQIKRYVDWLEQYYLPNMISDIQPVLISKKIVDKTDNEYKTIIDSFRKFNKENSNCLKLKYIEYEVANNDLKFTDITY